MRNNREIWKRLLNLSDFYRKKARSSCKSTTIWQILWQQSSKKGCIFEFHNIFTVFLRCQSSKKGCIFEFCTIFSVFLWLQSSKKSCVSKFHIFRYTIWQILWQQSSKKSYIFEFHTIFSVLMILSHETNC